MCNDQINFTNQKRRKLEAERNECGIKGDLGWAISERFRWDPCWSPWARRRYRHQSGSRRSLWWIGWSSGCARGQPDLRRRHPNPWPSLSRLAEWEAKHGGRGSEILAKAIGQRTSIEREIGYGGEKDSVLGKRGFWKRKRLEALEIAESSQLVEVGGDIFGKEGGGEEVEVGPTFGAVNCQRFVRMITLTPSVETQRCKTTVRVPPCHVPLEEDPSFRPAGSSRFYYFAPSPPRLKRVGTRMGPTVSITGKVGSTGKNSPTENIYIIEEKTSALVVLEFWISFFFRKYY